MQRRIPGTFNRLCARATDPKRDMRFVEPSQEKPAERPIALDVAKDALDLDFSSGVDYSGSDRHGDLVSLISEEFLQVFWTL